MCVIYDLDIILNHIYQILKMVFSVKLILGANVIFFYLFHPFFGLLFILMWKLILYYFIEVQVIYNVLISTEEQSDSVLYIYTFLIYILFYYNLSQEIR